MRRLFFFIVIAVFIAALLVYGISHDTGYVRISYGHTLIESNVWVLAALNLLAITLIVAVYSIVKNFGKGAGSLVRWTRIRPKRKANEETEQGLLAFLEGDWEKSQKLLTRSARHTRMPIVNLLAAANAASQRGLQKESSQLLKQAHDVTGGSELAASLTQARLHVENGRHEAALAVLVRLKKAHPKHPYVTALLIKTYTELEDWEHLVTCFEDDTANQLELDVHFERDVWSKLFASYAEKLKREKSQGNLADILSELWKRIPNKLRFNEQIIYAYTRELLTLEFDQEAEVILRKALETSWSENLIDAYGQARGKDKKEQLLRAEMWLKERPNSPRLLLAAGRLSLRCELWGKAVEYFTASQTQQSSLEACAELYRLSCRLNKPEHETRSLLNKLMQHVNLPELPLPK